VHEHRRPADDQRLIHMDCYRIKNVDDAETVGLDDILDGKGIVIFEWPERIDDILPVNRLWIEFKSMEPTRRNFVFDGVGERAKELIEQFRESTFGV
jgi:tRNA threonylcarbamoyladenosine biosynthesis protein TsaE